MQQGSLARYKLYPSSLLWLDSLSQAGKDLRARCCQIQACDTDMVKGLAADAHRLLARGDASGGAIVLICLADRCRDAGELVLAREYCEEAVSHFSCYDDCRHAHNLAVTYYALGLVYQSLGLETDAIGSYDRALEAFDEARSQWMWAHECAKRMMNECDEVVRWIRELRQGLALGQPAPPLLTGTLVKIPMWSTSAGSLLRVREEPVDWVDVEVSALGLANFALLINGNSMVGLGVQNGDVVLVQETADWPADGQIVVVRMDRMESESVLKRFYRRQDHICLEPANERYPFLIVLPNWRLKEEVSRRYAQSHPERGLEFFLESSVHCVGWYCGKVG
ncbi:MAG: hypothetical protein GX597_26850 [Anaerolineaceae bacterium]|nr:hypothetical protein [Anaerolineaceae bacterium]